MEFEYALQVYLKQKDINDIPILYKDSVNLLLSRDFSKLLSWLKRKKWNEIKVNRNNFEQSGLPFKNSILDYDVVSVIRLIQARDGLKEALDAGLITNENANITWTTQDNSSIVLSYSDLKTIPFLALDYIDSLHKKSRKYRNIIENATNIEDVIGVVWEK